MRTGLQEMVEEHQIGRKKRKFSAMSRRKKKKKKEKENKINLLIFFFAFFTLIFLLPLELNLDGILLGTTFRCFGDG